MYTQEKAREYLADWIKPSTVIYTQTEYTRGSTDWVRVFVAPKRNQIVDVTHLAGPAIGRKPKDRHGWQIGLPGGSYSKGLDVYLDIRYALKHQKPGSVEGQNKWREI